MLINIVRKVTMYDLKKHARFGSPNWILLDPGREFFKPQEVGWIGSVDMAIRLDNFLFSLWWKFQGHSYICLIRTHPLAENLQINLPVRESSRKHGCDTKLLCFPWWCTWNFCTYTDFVAFFTRHSTTEDGTTTLSRKLTRQAAVDRKPLPRRLQAFQCRRL